MKRQLKLEQKQSISKTKSMNKKTKLESLKEEHKLVIILEDGILDGGFGEKIARYYGVSDMKVLNYGIKKELLDRYVPEELMKKRLIDEQMVEDIISIIK